MKRKLKRTEQKSDKNGGETNQTEWKMFVLFRFCCCCFFMKWFPAQKMGVKIEKWMSTINGTSKKGEKNMWKIKKMGTVCVRLNKSKKLCNGKNYGNCKKSFFCISVFVFVYSLLLAESNYARKMFSKKNIHEQIDFYGL